MPLYQRFARIYRAARWTQFSQHLADFLPELLAHYNLPSSGSLLDVACGEGTFALQAAKTGWKVTGLDQSAEMLALAHASAQNLPVDFIQADMRTFHLSPEMDIVTCWFDSLNYLQSEDDLTAAFKNIRHALKPGGWFFFDMNTVRGLTVQWQASPVLLQMDSEDLFIVSRPGFNYENQTASLHITIFEKNGELWERCDETHFEKAFPVRVIETCLAKAGLEVIDRFSSLRNFLPCTPEDNRVWYAVQKPAGV